MIPLIGAPKLRKEFPELFPSDRHDAIGHNGGGSATSLTISQGRFAVTEGGEPIGFALDHYPHLALDHSWEFRPWKPLGRIKITMKSKVKVWSLPFVPNPRLGPAPFSC
jgi:hypothetical protein